MANNYDITQKLQAIADAITHGGGGGGTTVVANPTGTPTDTLTTIQIGSTIYDIAGSGGGGGVISNILYFGNAYASIINLNYDMFNYDLINILVADSNGYTRGFAFSPSELLSGQTIGFDNQYGYVWYVITSGTVLTASAHSNFFIKDIVGFKSSGGALPELISEDFDPTRAYTIGEYCIYDNTLYKFTSAKSAGAWDNTKVSNTTVGEELNALNSNTVKFVNLWTNPNPSANFAAQSIVLSSSDYDVYEIFCSLTNGSIRQLKGYDTYISYDSSSGGVPVNYTRGVTYTDSTHLAVTDTRKNGMTQTAENNLMVPLKVVGIKF